LEKTLPRLYKSGEQNSVPAEPSNSGANPPGRGGTIVAAGLLLLALAWIVIYTNRGAFLSPLALVVVAAIGVAALLLQLRLRPNVPPMSTRNTSARGSLWINALGVLFAVVAVVSDLFHLPPAYMLISALLAVVCFAVSGVVVLSALRKGRS
jgi:peptidoglycan/LPS O-acetylase OafA/YrhL